MKRTVQGTGKHIWVYELQKQSFADILQNYWSVKIRKIGKKTTVIKPGLRYATLQQKIPVVDISCKFYKIFQRLLVKNTSR